jgi:hypothetical protein
MTDLYISLAVVLALRLWNAKTIQAWVARKSLTLPQWAQPFPPIVLSVLATVVVALVQGKPPTAEDTSTAGLLTVGLYHVAKRWIPVVAISKVAKASLTGFVLVLLTSCSGQPLPTLPTVCPLPSEYLSRLPTPAAVSSAVQAAQGVVEQGKVVAEDPSGGAAVLVAAKALDSIEPLCPSLTEIAKTDCAAKVAEARALLAKEESTRQQICSAVKLAVFVAQVAEDTVPLVALDEVCR